MKLFVAISSCQAWEDNGYNQVMRECWLKDCAQHGVDYRFFHGHYSKPGDDVVYVDCPDPMASLTYKTQEKLKWALAWDYTHIFCCFPDTYCRIERLLKTAFDKWDYYGDFRGEHATPDNFASGGPGYCLSRKAAQILAEAPVRGVWRDDDHIQQAEDLWAGQILARCYDARGLRYFDDQRFINHGRSRPGPLGTNDVITTHLSCPTPYTSDAMLATHKYWLESQ